MSDQPWELDDAEQLWVGVLSQVDEDALAAPSGCAGWSNRDLINHVIGGGHRYAMLLEGASAAQTTVTRDVDYVADGLPAAFTNSQNLFRAALAAADLDATVDHRVAPRPGRDLLPMRIMELTLHARDLATAIDTPWEPSEALADYVLAEAGPILDEFRAVGAIGVQTEPASTSAVHRLLARAGRA